MSFAGEKVLWKVAGAPNSQEALLQHALAISSGCTLWVVLLHRFPPPALSVPVDQHRGAQPTKNTFSGESGCLGKNVTEIPC